VDCISKLPSSVASLTFESWSIQIVAFVGPLDKAQKVSVLLLSRLEAWTQQRSAPLATEASGAKVSVHCDPFGPLSCLDTCEHNAAQVLIQQISIRGG